MPRLRARHQRPLSPGFGLPENNRVGRPDHKKREAFMSLLDGLLGGVIGGEMATVVNSFIQQHGGIQGMVAQFEKQGLGPTVQSWIGNGPNQPISPDQVHQVFGSGMIAQMAAKAGMNPRDLAQKLSQILPGAIDKLTPEGRVPPKSA
jgi:uncharacterized protein YidB (DUF937 family)